MSHAEKTNAQVFAVVPAPVVIALPFAIVSLRSIYLCIQLFLHPVPTTGSRLLNEVVPRICTWIAARNQINEVHS